MILFEEGVKLDIPEVKEHYEARLELIEILIKWADELTFTDKEEIDDLPF